MKTPIRVFVVSAFAFCVQLAQAGPESGYGSGQGMMQGPTGMEVFRMMDSNADGVVSKAEYDDFYSRKFDATDANKDGMLSFEEMNAANNMATGNSATSHLDTLFNAADTNHDGGLDRKEAAAMPMLSMYFDEVDANKDGKVTRREYFNAMPLLHRAKQDRANSL